MMRNLILPVDEWDFKVFISSVDKWLKERSQRHTVPITVPIFLAIHGQRSKLLININDLKFYPL